MGKNVFRFFGVITILFEAAIAFTLTTPKMNLANAEWIVFVRLAMFFILATIVAVGLLFVKRWAAVLFSAATGIYGSWLILGSITQVPFPYILINMAAGTLFLLPLVLMIGAWDYVKRPE